MDQVELKARVREERGGNAVYRLREKAETPAVLYGKKEEGVSLALDSKELGTVLSTKRGRNVMVNLKVEGKADVVAMFKEVQMHPVTGKIIHVDLYKVNMKEEIIVSISTRIIGEAPGVKLGGVLDQPLRSLKVKGLPGELPEAILIDVSGLAINDSIHVGDLKLGAGIKLLDNPKDVVVIVSVVKVEEEVVPGAVVEEVATGPEVIGEKEREEKRLAAEKEKEGKTKEKAEAKTEAKAEAKKEIKK